MGDQARPFKIPESVLVVVHTPRREVLLIERADAPGFWQSVTGSKDHPDEPLALTAAREVWEETGIHCAEGTPLAQCLRPWGIVNEYDIYPRYLHRYAPGVLRNREHLFGLCVPEPVTPVLSPREHTAWRWLPWREAADACYSPSNAEAILLLPQFMG
ncbi:dihydroneopterin triphosphate diphosphatase [Variovorax dokdonensis]|uniref:Dihydroneopterin triphosphate diphosphatase n=1 Tax=Variovorax dokdonensis TaxID=344883 RepID=A0ABT7N6Y5_9BURK|nr:dihydroneopterin triphosphate diphosphatase [Variovorax dokdonensis]MDM0043706.1 dihydroneopterin triphosphate diphosphatase [Variovorax dokdonensis]